jgi:hypothetical protein
MRCDILRIDSLCSFAFTVSLSQTTRDASISQSRVDLLRVSHQDGILAERLEARMRSEGAKALKGHGVVAVRYRHY